MSVRRTYLQLLNELEDAKNRIDRINMRIHELLDLYDEIEAAKIQKEHQDWMDGDDTQD